MGEGLQKTAGQVERDISQRVNALYRSELAHQPGKITCQFFEDKLAIVIEDALSKTEQLLVRRGSLDVAEDTHEQISEVFRVKVSQAIEEIIGIEVVDMMLDSNLETARSSMMIILQQSPEVKNPSAIPKNLKK